MSLYQPQHGTLSIAKREDGWWVFDLHGPFCGPYQSQSDALAVIRGIEEADALEMARDF